MPTAPRDAFRSRPHTDARTTHIFVGRRPSDNTRPYRPAQDVIVKHLTLGFRTHVHEKEVTSNQRNVQPQSNAIRYNKLTTLTQNFALQNMSYRPSTDIGTAHLTAI